MGSVGAVESLGLGAGSVASARARVGGPCIARASRFSEERGTAELALCSNGLGAGSDTKA